mmetsp:Transcript_42649/g.132716  ORF Transcript_42649/g.132716 Transcript_42649/m.132716 type:complete len:211 (+) Transcript_42649:101-733(+)
MSTAVCTSAGVRQAVFSVSTNLGVSSGWPGWRSSSASPRSISSSATHCRTSGCDFSHIPISRARRMAKERRGLPVSSRSMVGVSSMTMGSPFRRRLAFTPSRSVGWRRHSEDSTRAAPVCSRRCRRECMALGMNSVSPSTMGTFSPSIVMDDIWNWPPCSGLSTPSMSRKMILVLSSMYLIFPQSLSLVEASASFAARASFSGSGSGKPS